MPDEPENSAPEQAPQDYPPEVPSTDDPIGTRIIIVVVIMVVVMFFIALAFLFEVARRGPA